jgi:hypothetical protein
VAISQLITRTFNPKIPWYTLQSVKLTSGFRERRDFKVNRMYRAMTCFNPTNSLILYKHILTRLNSIVNSVITWEYF